MDSIPRPRSEPRCPSWCLEAHYEGLADFLEYHGGPLSNESSAQPPLSLVLPVHHLPPSSTPNSPSSARSGFLPPFQYQITPLQFAPKVNRIFEPHENPNYSFECVVCGPSILVHANPPKSTCQHFIRCSECQSRIIRQILRCGRCCSDLTGKYPVCELEECEQTAKDFAPRLQTGCCPRCGDKLGKDVCGATCSRKLSPAYLECQEILMGRVAAMVLHPQLCTSHYPGTRPCCHYARCETHGKITRGRSRRCAACKGNPEARRRSIQ